MYDSIARERAKICTGRKVDNVCTVQRWNLCFVAIQVVVGCKKVAAKVKRERGVLFKGF